MNQFAKIMQTDIDTLYIKYFQNKNKGGRRLKIGQKPNCRYKYM